MRELPKFWPAGIRVVCAALVGVLLMTLSACATGDGVKKSFSQQFAGDPAVLRVDLSSADNMPFTGGVGGTVTLRDGLSDAAIRDFAERVGEFAAQHAGDGAGSRVRIDLVMNDWAFPVLASPQANDALLTLLSELRADQRVSAATLSSKQYQSDVTHVTLVAATPAEIPALITDAPAAFAAAGMRPPMTLKSPAEEPAPIELSGRMGPWAEAAFHAYDALRAEIPLTSFRAEKDAVTVTLVDEHDLDIARALTQATLDSTSAEVFFQSDLVTLFPGARGDQARSLLAQVDAAALADVVSVWTNDQSATLTLNSTANLAELARAISDLQSSIALDQVTLAVGQGDEQTFRLQATPGELEASTRTALALAKRDHVTRVRLEPGNSFDVGLDSPTDIASYAAPLRSLSAFDERLCFDWTTSTFCVETAPTIDPDSIRGNGAQAGRSFVEAWNAAG
ncbi:MULTISPECIES: hypothetical protein [unclassified Leucobacter]|uniref:hypothetical protein n=1 Tax=unclassified Leucobacter TaxID=2621730 RepID=UPI00165DDA61|nr:MULTISPECIES: hypothetical protein [unclassified Leucobacter]MBC9926262.1 hypothetical protein [Leucobacter sp. cx-169]